MYTDYIIAALTPYRRYILAFGFIVGLIGILLIFNFDTTTVSDTISSIPDKVSIPGVDLGNSDSVDSIKELDSIFITLGEKGGLDR